jgi:lysophospholipase L1-like esterase
LIRGFVWVAAAAAATMGLTATAHAQQQQQQQQQQQSALLPNSEVLKVSDRAWQLVESISLAIPDMGRTSSPIQESLRQTRANLRSRPNHTAYTYTLLASLRAYAALVDAAQKPFPMPAEAVTQIVELRTMVERLEVHFRALLDSAELRLRPADRDNLRRYEEANARLAAPSGANPRVVFYGDSITDAWRLNEYFPDKDYVNRGISGQVTGEMLGRMKADVLDLKPQAMLILAGTNDLARGTALGTITNNYTMIAELAKAHGIKVVFASVLPVSDYHKAANPDNERSNLRPPASIKALNDWLKRYCAASGCTYLDYFTALADRTGMLKAELADDGLHPNAAGYRVMAPLAGAAIGSLGLGQMQPEKKKRRLFSK